MLTYSKTLFTKAIDFADDSDVRNSLKYFFVSKWVESNYFNMDASWSLSEHIGRFASSFINEYTVNKAYVIGQFNKIISNSKMGNQPSWQKYLFMSRYECPMFRCIDVYDFKNVNDNLNFNTNGTSIPEPYNRLFNIYEQEINKIKQNYTTYFNYVTTDYVERIIAERLFFTDYVQAYLSR